MEEMWSSRQTAMGGRAVRTQEASLPRVRLRTTSSVHCSATIYRLGCCCFYDRLLHLLRLLLLEQCWSCIAGSTGCRRELERKVGVPTRELQKAPQWEALRRDSTACRCAARTGSCRCRRLCCLRRPCWQSPWEDTVRQASKTGVMVFLSPFFFFYSYSRVFN